MSKNYVSKSQISAEAKSYCIAVTATRNGERYALRSENIFDFIRIKYILYPEPEIAKVNTRINAAEKDIDNLSNALETDIKQIKKKLAQSRFGDCVSLLHFSDIHADRNALKQILIITIVILMVLFVLAISSPIVTVLYRLGGITK